MTSDPMARMKQDFIGDACDTIDRISQSLAALGSQESPSRSQLDWLFRTVHSLKGTSGMFELHEVSDLAASVEDLLDVVRSGRLELDTPKLDLLIEAFDELAILLQRARGEEVRSAWSEVRSRLNRLTATLSDAAPAEGRGHRRGLSLGLPGDLEFVLSADELAAIRSHLAQGARVYRLALEFEGDRPLESEELVLRRLQKAGEIIAVLPPGDDSAGPCKRVLSLVYAPLENEADIRELVDTCQATIRTITRDTARASPGSVPSDSQTSSPASEAATEGSSPAPAPLSVKVQIGVLDAMMNTVSELYSVRLDLLGIARRLPHTDETRRLRDDLLKAGLVLSNRLGSIEESIAGVRLVPVSLLFERYKGEVRRLARRSGKKVSLEFEGESTRIDRAMLDSLHDPLLHIIRNAVDHGIEPPDKRLAKQKPETGRISLRARQEASHICIEVADDGQGVDPARVREKAIEKRIPNARSIPPLSLIFEPGMSTRGDVSDISGRGVGLDAAKTKIASLKGMIVADSEIGRGTRLSVYVPLTLAVSRGVLAEENGLPTVIPLRSVIEVIALGVDRGLELRRSGTLLHKGRRLEALPLSSLLGTVDRNDSRSAVILGVGEKRQALVAQRVTGETEVVCRPLPEVMTAPGFVAGATELHDGRPAIIIQPEDLLRRNQVWQSNRSELSSRLAGLPPGGGQLSEDPVRLLLFRSGKADYGISLDLLKEVVGFKRITEVPVLGDCWQGLFFNRGMCHGLLRLFGDEASCSESMNVAVLAYPQRCGIGMDEILGNLEIPVSEVDVSTGDGGSGPLRPLGRFHWEGRDVTIVGLITRGRD